MINFHDHGVHKSELFFSTPDYADSDRPIGPAPFTVVARAVEAGRNRDGNLLIFT